MTFQIRDETFGRALVETDTPAEALESYLLGRLKGELRGEIETSEDGSEATVEYQGERLTAVRV